MSAYMLRTKLFVGRKIVITRKYPGRSTKIIISRVVVLKQNF
jgi:hypothetical protein